MLNTINIWKRSRQVSCNKILYGDIYGKWECKI